MSERFNLQDGTGVLLADEFNQPVVILRETAPTNGQPGFSAGCLWLRRVGNGANTTLYVNEGTSTSATWAAK